MSPVQNKTNMKQKQYYKKFNKYLKKKKETVDKTEDSLAEVRCYLTSNLVLTLLETKDNESQVKTF